MFELKIGNIQSTQIEEGVELKYKGHKSVRNR